MTTVLWLAAGIRSDKGTAAAVAAAGDRLDPCPAHDRAVWSVVTVRVFVAKNDDADVACVWTAPMGSVVFPLMIAAITLAAVVLFKVVGAAF